MYQTVEDYLLAKSIPCKLTSGSKEVQIQCFSCDDKKKHLYIDNIEGCYYCQKCSVKGSWTNLAQNLGDISSPTLESQKSRSNVEHRAHLDVSKDNFEQKIDRHVSDVPVRINEYLVKERGLTDETIKTFKIGWDGSSITYPIVDADGKVINIRHRRDPNKTKGQKYWNEKGGKAAIFNSVALQEKPKYIVIAEGEFDAMVAIQNGFAAVSSTSGAGTFKEEWIGEFDGIETIYICYDTDKAGKDGAKKVARLLGENARIVNLPADDEKVDITDYFVKLKHTPDDFQKLLDESKPLKEKFELVSEGLEKSLHPAVDFFDNQLFYTFEITVKTDSEQKQALVTISSNKQVGINNKKAGTVKLGNKTLKLKKVTAIPGSQLRWRADDVNRFIKDKDITSPALPFIEIKEVLSKFVDFRDEADSDVITLWLMGTYCFSIFDAFPYLYFVGVKRSGKTKTLLLIEKLAFNAILSSNISPAVLFRIVEARRPTLALDEGEQLSDKTRKQELRELLNSGYKRGAPAYRTTKNSKGNFCIEAFEVYSPKAIANIAGLNDVLEDRSITITMVRTKDPSKGNLAITEGSEDWWYLRSLLYSFALTHAPAIFHHYTYDDEVNALLNRQNELWRPLLSIAKVIDKEVDGTFERIKTEAIKRAEEASNIDLEDFDSAVLLALRELSSDEDKDLNNKVVREKASEFLETDQRQYFTSRGVGAALKRFGIKGKKIHGYYRYTISRSIVEDLLSRYGIPNEETFG